LQVISTLLAVLLLIAAPGCVFLSEDEADEADEVQEEASLEITLYFACPEAVHTGEPGEYGYVTPVAREVPHTDEVLRTAVQELIRGPEEDERAWCDECDEKQWEPCDECLEHRVSPVAPDSVEIRGINIEGGIASIDLCRELFAAEDGVAGTLGGAIFVQSMVWTATEFPTVDEVQVLVEGEYFDDGHMIWEEPRGRDDLTAGK